jgi:WD40 repeat protein
MSGTTFTWAGTASSDWTQPTNWLNGSLVATTDPNGAGDIAFVNFDDGLHDAIISGGSLITVGGLNVGNPTAPAAPGVVGGHVLVGGGPAIGGGGGGTLISVGSINVTSTNSGGGLVGGPASFIGAPTLNIGTGAIIGGGGTFDVTTLTNLGMIQADGGDFVLGPLVINGGTITGPGSLEVDGSSTLALNSVTAENIVVNVHSQQTASIIFGTVGLAFTGALQLNNANSHVNLFFQGQTITGAAFSAGTLVVKGTGGAVLDAIPFSSNGISSFQVDTSTLPGYGEISILPAPTAPGTLLQNDSGQAAIWQVGGTLIASASVIAPTPGATWSLVGSGAFLAGDANDLVWQSQVDGSVAVWNVAGTDTTFTSGTVVANPGSAWQVKGTGDFYGNSDTDILLQHQDGSVAVWDVNGAGAIVQSNVVADPGSAWQIKGTGDFYHDGNTDILLQNQDGSVAIWDMSAGAIVKSGVVAANPGPSWQVRGTGDFFGNGDADILFQSQDGSVAIWDMTNGTTIASAAVVANPGAAWHVQGTGNFNNDGKTDIALQNDNGSVAVWDMNGNTIAASAELANPGTAWHVVSGSSNMRFISSAAAGETLAATPTMPDEFVFTSFAAGAHTIAGFTATQDIVELSSARFADFAAVQAATTATSGGAMVNLGNSSSLLLSGVDPASLHASNFALA